MQISLTFDPAKDLPAAVHAVVEAAYGKSQQTIVMGNVTAANSAHTPAAVSQTVAAVVTPDQSNDAAQGASPLEQPPIHSTAPTQPDTSGSATVATPAGVELDANGVPWDARIHSGAIGEDGKHKKTAKGVWTKRKGCPDSEYEAVTAELKNLMAASPATALPPGGVLGNPTNHPHQVAVPVPGQPEHFVVQPMPGALATATPAQVQSVPVAMAQDGASAQPAAAAPVETQPAQVLPGGAQPMSTLAPMPMPTPVAPHDYVTLAQWVARACDPAQGGKLTVEHVEHFCRQAGIVDGAGIGQFSLVQNRPEFVGWLHQAFVQQIAAMG